jgi:MscS family membrane protein
MPTTHPLRRILLSLALLVSAPAWAQLAAPGAAPAAAQPEIPQDALGRTTPKGTVLGFLVAARKGDNALAAQYLNTRLRGEAAAGLAQQLGVILDRRLPPSLAQLSDKPEGSLADLLNPNQELVGTISGGSGDVQILVERVGRGKVPIWLFSSKTLESVPALYKEVNVLPVESVLPEFLTNTQLLGIPLYEWLAVVVGMPLLYFLTLLLNRFLSRGIGRLRRRLRGKQDLPDPEIVPMPARLLLLVLAIRWATSLVSLPLLARQFWSSTSIVITIAAVVWLLVLFTGRSEERIHRLLQKRKLRAPSSILRLTKWAVDLLIILVGVLVILHHFGVDPTALLAGVGVGGIAVALAAQKTLENVIGGASLLFDRVVRKGDTLNVGTTQGTVEDVGLRSTRIRTLDRSVVDVPNGQLANMTLENLSARDKFWFHPILALSYGTTSEQVHTVLERIRRLLEDDRSVERDSVRVRLLRFGTYSLDIEVFAYIPATDWAEFLGFQERLLLGIMECVESSGAQIVTPTQMILSTASNASDDVAARPLRKVPAPDSKRNDDAPAAKTA